MTSKRVMQAVDSVGAADTALAKSLRLQAERSSRRCALSREGSGEARLQGAVGLPSTIDDRTSATLRRHGINAIRQVPNHGIVLDPTSSALEPLLTVSNLHDVLELQLPSDPARRWTYHYDAFEQIDFLLVSRPLKDRLVEAGVVRRGIHDLEALTTAAGGTIEVEKQYDTVTHWTNAASDHGAVWAEFNIR